MKRFFKNTELHETLKNIGEEHDVMAGVSDELLASLHPLELKVLPHIRDGMLQSELCVKAAMQEAETTRALQWLENKAAVLCEQIAEHEVMIDENGKRAVQLGMPETRFLLAARQAAGTGADIAARAKLDEQEAGVSIGLLKKAGNITVGKDNVLTVTTTGMTLDTNLDDKLGLLRKLDKHAQPLDKLTKKEREALEQLKSRRRYVLLKERKDRRIRLTDLGKALAATNISKLSFAEKLTAEDLATGAWKDKKYRSFDVTVRVPGIPAGKEHFIQEAIEYIQSVWVDMGFVEHEGAIVQSAFWDLDALFVPQDHPARETQDTFYLEKPSRGMIEKLALERVKAAHENGGVTGSKGWRYTYSKDEAQRLLLRTHDTVLSAQTLWAIRNGQATIPGKYFAVAPVWRNEKADWKHLFEFHQIGGIVVDPNANFAQLIRYLEIFFAKMGFQKIRLRPHHFPYTEPSVEVDVWNPRKNQWVEFGGAGVLRPEVTKTLIGEEIPVLAWGLGLERIVVEYFGLSDLRDLYRNDVKQLREMKRFIKIDEASTPGSPVTKNNASNGTSESARTPMLKETTDTSTATRQVF